MRSVIKIIESLQFIFPKVQKQTGANLTRENLKKSNFYSSGHSLLRSHLGRREGSIKMQTHANRRAGEGLCESERLNIIFKNLVPSP